MTLSKEVETELHQALADVYVSPMAHWLHTGQSIGHAQRLAALYGVKVVAQIHDSITIDVPGALTDEEARLLITELRLLR